MPLKYIATPKDLLAPDPNRIREIATWFEQSGMTHMAAAAYQAARDLDAAAHEEEDRREADRLSSGPPSLYWPSFSPQDEPESVRALFLSLEALNQTGHPPWNGLDDRPEG